MIDNKVFNKKITELENLENSNVSKTIKLIKSTSKYNFDFCDLLDCFASELGLGFTNTPRYHYKNDKLLGYIPNFKFFPNNVFNEVEEYKELTTELLDLKTSSNLLAKETIYQIMRFSSLENFIIEKYSIEI